MKKTDTRICARCGLVTTSQGISRHMESCNRLPLPDQLVQDLLNGNSLHSLGKIYGTSASVIKKRALMSDDAVLVVWRRSKCTKTDKPKCVCGVLLDYPTVPKGDGEMCGYCVADAARRVRVKA